MPGPGAGRQHAVFVLTDYIPATGGTTTQTRAQALELVRRGWAVSVVTRRLARDWPRRASLEGVEVYRRGRPGYGRVAKAVDLSSTFWWLRRHRDEVSVVQVVMDADYAVVAVVAGLGGRLSLMWATNGDPEFFLGAGTLGRLRRRALRSCQHVALSEVMASELAARGLPATVIPVPVDRDRFHRPTADERRASRDRLGLTDEVVVAFTGHLERRKGPDLLLPAFARLLAEGRHIRLLVVGGGKGGPDDLSDWVRDYVRDHGLADQVTITGAVSDVAPYLWAADVFCLPSWREGMPNSILEAMSCGLAVVAPASAGGRELLDGGAGVIPPSNSSDDLTAALRPLVADADLRAALGDAATARAAAFALPAVVTAYEALWAGRAANSGAAEDQPAGGGVLSHG